MSEQPNIHDVVRQRYGSIAEGQRTSCCSDDVTADCCGTSAKEVRFYDAEMVADLPVDVTNLSLGCGDPVSIAGLKAGETVLDLGSGGGIDCFMAAKQVGPSGYVIGVDMTPAMLEKANANKAAIGVENVEFRAGQIEALPVEDNSIDVIMSNCVINLAPDKLPVFREAFRVLKPGGRVSISDIVTEGDFSDALRADLAQWAECVTGAIDVEAYTDLMRQAGFTGIQIVSKEDANKLIESREGMPTIYSARITATKPA